MPKFMDSHVNLPLPAEVVQSIRVDAKAGTRDKFGVAQLELYHNAEGRVFCLLDGPDEDAVRKHHEAMGVSCGDVESVESLL